MRTFRSWASSSARLLRNSELLAWASQCSSENSAIGSGLLVSAGLHEAVMLDSLLLSLLLKFLYRIRPKAS